VLGYVVVFVLVPASLLGKLVGTTRPERVSGKTFPRQPSAPPCLTAFSDPILLFGL
jgi:hypothetical protein